MERETQERKKVLVVIPVEERHRRMLEEAFPEAGFLYRRTAEPADLAQANIIIGNVPPNRLHEAAKLEWMQLNSAGADEYIRERALPAGVLLTNASGAYGLAISEHMLAGTLMLIKRLNRYHTNQLRHRWLDEGRVQSIEGSRTLIVGLGDIGSEYGRRMKALGSHVAGIRRHADHKPAWLDELDTMDALDAELAKADFVSLSLPATPATYHLIDYRRLSLMKRSAVLLNVGRGNVVVSDDLCRALNERLLFGAFLDVTDPEPLPSGHPLWDAENVLITPHISGNYHLPETFERIVRIACENLRRFRGGETLKNLVDLETDYRRYVPAEE